jgi:hypothetical protein
MTDENVSAPKIDPTPREQGDKPRARNWKDVKADAIEQGLTTQERIDAAKERIQHALWPGPVTSVWYTTHEFKPCTAPDLHEGGHGPTGPECVALAGDGGPWGCCRPQDHPVHGGYPAPKTCTDVPCVHD